MGRLLVACEMSGVIRDAFIRQGYEAVSCDVQFSERPGPHYCGDVRDILDRGWDMLIAHPPCTYLAVSGARWFAGREAEQKEALQFVRLLMEAPIPRICIENPASIISTRVRKPDQVINPFMFGHPEKKRTCLWLKGLPPLFATDVMEERQQRVHQMGPIKGRSRERSRTLIGVAEAMARQWGPYLAITERQT
jgi:hypothetical protein